MTFNNNSEDSAFPQSVSGQITWNGPAIPCLNICQGEKLNKVVYLIATKVCELTSPTDLSTLSLQCALDIFDKDEVGNRTLKTVIQLLIDNDCGLKELIDAINERIDGLSENNLVLDLGCLLTYFTDDWGKQLPYTVESILQQLIHKICQFEDYIVGLVDTVATVKSEIENHIAHHPVPAEVVISTCTSGSAKPVSQAVIDLAVDYCEWKNHIGTTAQVQTAISRQTSAINTMMRDVIGWIPNPLTLAHSLNNAWLFEKYNSDRLTLIENNCCKVTCKDVTIGFNISLNEDSSAMFLTFSTSAGSDIPAGFTDMGSTVTIKDKNGLSYTYSLQIAQEATLGEYPISGLDTSAPLSINLQAFVGNSSLQCQKCINKQFTVSGSNCCVITNNGDTEVTIVYTT